MAETVGRTRTSRAKVPTTFVDYVRGVGPGIVIGVFWLGAGDLVSSSVSGANYGYALLWALAVATLARFFVVSALTKYQLCNSQGDQTILDGFGRVWKGFPLLLGILSVLTGIVYQVFLFVGAGTALYYLFGQVGGEYGVFIFALVTLVLAVALAGRPNEYRGLEIVARVAVAIFAVTFVWALIGSGIDFGALLRGLFTFDLPPDEGPFGSILIVISIIGTVGGSVANLVYPYFVRDKGWRGPEYRRLQVVDLLFGVVTLILLNFAVWIVAAELLRGEGGGIDAPDDLARMMELAVGPLGPPLMWLAIFFTVFDNISTLLYAFPRLMVEAVHKRYPRRAERYGLPTRGAEHHAIPADEEDRDVLPPSDAFVGDPLFKWVQVALLAPAIIFTLPFAPDFVFLTIIGNALQVLAVPAIIVGLIWMTANRRWMPGRYVNRWWENAILLAIGGIALWATYNLIVDTVGVVAGLFGG